MITQSINLPNNATTSPILVHINQAPMIAMIDCMLGGDGTYMENIDSNYSYTDLEIPIYKKIMGHFLGFTADAWENYIHLETDKIVLEENPSLFQEIRLDETVAIVILKVRIGDIEGMMSICIPRNLLTEIFTIIDSKKNVFDINNIQEADTRKFILSKIKQSALTVSANMGKMEIPIRDIHNLKVGDIINLNKPKESEIYIDIEKNPWLSGKVGTYKNNIAVSVDNRLDTDSDITQTVIDCEENNI